MQISIRVTENSNPEAEKILNFIISFCVPRGFEYDSLAEELVLADVDAERALYFIEHISKELRSNKLLENVMLLEFKIFNI